MSTVDADLDVDLDKPVRCDDLEVTEARQAQVGSLTVRRLLPLRLRRSVGPWCFVDHYGPADVDGVAGMQVPPHPHIGLQTVTWLLAGDVLHRDSLGNEQMIRPGQLNLMTAGRGIAHAEESPAPHQPWLHGVQLWVALPEASRNVAPAFEHHAALPAGQAGDLQVTVFMGTAAGLSSPATAYSGIVGAELAAGRHAAAALPVDPEFEHVLFVAAGSAELAGRPLGPGRLLYAGPGREQLTVSAAAGSRLFLLGGRPLGERLLMWWNFVARSPEEIASATADWRAGDSRFGQVGGYQGDPLPAPALDPSRLRAR